MNTAAQQIVRRWASLHGMKLDVVEAMVEEAMAATELPDAPDAHRIELDKWKEPRRSMGVRE